jgi:hypothetical protein
MFGESFATIRQMDNVSKPEGEGMSDAAWKALMGDMKQETALFIEHLFREGGRHTDLIDGDYTFVNANLARHYGIPEPAGDVFVRVELPRDSGRGGLLGQGGFLAQRTSLIFRGFALVTGYMCGVLEAPSDPDLLRRVADQLEAAGTEQEKSRIRAEDPTCIGCHRLMDPLGQAFDHFDAAGRYTDLLADGKPVDTHAQYMGEAIDGPDDVRALVLKNEFGRCVTSRVLMDAIGRRLDLGDKRDDCATRRALALAGDKAGLRDIVAGVLLSDAFRSRVVGEKDEQ